MRFKLSTKELIKNTGGIEIASSIFNALLSMFLIACMPIAAYSQTFIGLEAGITSNFFHNRPFNSDSEVHNEFGKEFNFVIQRRIGFLTVESGIADCEKNYSLRRTNEYKGLYQQFNNSYLQIPLLLGKSCKISHLRLNFLIGPYAAYWLHGQVDGVYPNILTIQNGNEFRTEFQRNMYQFVTIKDKRLEFGLNASLQSMVKLVHHFDLKLNITYSYALTDQQKDYAINLPEKKNRVLSVSSGLVREF